MARWPATHREPIPAKRLANQLQGKGFKAKKAGMEAAGRQLETQIKLNAPVETGELQRSVTVRPVVRTPNPRFVVETAQHGLFIEHGTPHITARRFIRGTAAHTRVDWEATGREAAKKAKK